MKKITLIVAIIVSFMMSSAFADNNLSVTFVDRQVTADSSTKPGAHFSAVITNTSSHNVTLNNVTFGTAQDPNSTGLSDVIADSDDSEEQNYLLHLCDGAYLAPHTSCSIPLVYVWSTSAAASQLLQVNAVGNYAPAPTPAQSIGSIMIGANSGLAISFTDSNNQPLSAKALSNLKNSPTQINFNAVITNTQNQAVTVSQVAFNNSLTTTGLSDITANAASDPASQTSALQSCNGKVLAAGATCSIPLVFTPDLSAVMQEVLNVAVAVPGSFPNSGEQSDVLPALANSAINASTNSTDDLSVAFNQNMSNQDDPNNGPTCYDPYGPAYQFFIHISNNSSHPVNILSITYGGDDGRIMDNDTQCQNITLQPQGTCMIVGMCSDSMVSSGSFTMSIPSTGDDSLAVRVTQTSGYVDAG